MTSNKRHISTFKLNSATPVIINNDPHDIFLRWTLSTKNSWKRTCKLTEPACETPKLSPSYKFTCNFFDLYKFFLTLKFIQINWPFFIEIFLSLSWQGSHNYVTCENRKNKVNFTKISPKPQLSANVRVIWMSVRGKIMS